MKICIVGKFPPIEGGVSMRTYWAAHLLAARGHDVHVVTNAREVRPPFRMHMRASDWARCAADYGAGRVAVHWTDPPDRSQRTVPAGSAFVSKLVGLAAQVHAESRIDVVYSHYLEPYGVAGHLVAEMAGAPHVTRMAGSDAGRLWHHPQLAPLYDHVLRTAQAVIAAGTVADRAMARGVDPLRLVPGGDFAVPEELFAGDGPVLDLAALDAEVADGELTELAWGGFAGDRPLFGVYGKLGETKGSFALLAALARVVAAGHDVGLVAMAHGPPSVERRFRDEACALGLESRIRQIPFLPHWRVPEFLRACRAVCCLEQDFPIALHNPIVPREVLLSGTCLVASAEMIRKLPAPELLAHGYNCFALRDATDVAELATTLARAAGDGEEAAAIGARGRAVARELQLDADFVERLERILDAAARRAPMTGRRRAASAPSDQPATERADGLASLFRLEARLPKAPDEWAALVAVLDPRARLDRPAEAKGRPVVLFEGGRNPVVVDEETASILALCDGRRTVAEIAETVGGAEDARRIEWIERLFALGLIGLREKAA